MAKTDVAVGNETLVQTGNGFCPVVKSANGRVKPDYVLIGGKEQRHPEAPISSNGARAVNAFGSPSDGMPALPQQDATASNRFWA